ncbi:MAG TPA: right-handed parallel beta-helix repeat-containing protein [Polyangiaceae bacterium]
MNGKRLAFALMLVACGNSSAGPDASPGDSSASDVVQSTDGSDASQNACGSVASFVPAWITGATFTKEIYVDPNGDDANDGSASKPFKTTAKAFSMIAPGVRINFKTGSYACPPLVQDVLATTTSPVVIRAVDGARTAKFDCGGTGDFYFSHVRAIVLDGLEIGNTAGHGVQLDSGSGFATKDLSSDFALMNGYVHDTQLAGIKVAQSQRIYVIGNEFSKCAAGRQCVEFVASDMPVIVGNDAHDSDAFDEVKGGAHGGIIAKNKVHDMNAGGGGILVGGDCTGQQFLVDTNADFEAENLVVWSNVITNANGFAFRVVGCRDCTVANNTYWSAAPAAILRILHDAFASNGSSTCDVPLHNTNVRIANNVFAWNKTSIDVIPTDEDPKNVIFDHNSWFATGDDVTKLYSDMPFTSEPTSQYNQDPKLVSPPTDVSLASGSPAKSAGSAIADVQGTFDGKCPASPPDIGAY